MGRRFNPRAGGQTKGCAPCIPHSGSRAPAYRDAELKPRPGPGAPTPKEPATFPSFRAPSLGRDRGRGRGRCGQARRAPREWRHGAERRGGQARRGVPAARPAPRASAPPRLAMVEQGDAAPLLRWAEGPAVSVPQDPALQTGGWARGGGGSGRAAADAPRRREPDEPAPREVLLQPGRLELGDVEEDQVVAVFVVTFDPRSGERRLGMERWLGAGTSPARFRRARGRDPLRAHSHPHTCIPPRSGVPGQRGHCVPRREPRDPRGFVPPPSPSRRGSQLRSGASSPLSRLLRFSAGGLVCGRGHVGFCFLCFPARLEGSFRCRKEGTHPHSPPRAYVASHAGPKRTYALCPPLLVVAPSEVTFPAAKFTFSEGLILRN